MGGHLVTEIMLPIGITPAVRIIVDKTDEVQPQEPKAEDKDSLRLGGRSRRRSADKEILDQSKDLPKLGRTRSESRKTGEIDEKSELAM